MRRVAVVGLMMLVVGCGGTTTAPPAAAPSVENAAESATAAPCVGAAPDCWPRTLTLTDVTGRAWSADQLTGKVIVLTFWATWASPSKAEVPTFSKLAVERGNRGVAVLGVLIEDIADADLQQFVADYGISYPVIRLDDTLASTFGLPASIPRTLVYDRTGHLHTARDGLFDAAELTALVDELLAD